METKSNLPILTYFNKIPKFHSPLKGYILLEGIDFSNKPTLLHVLMNS